MGLHPRMIRYALLTAFLLTGCSYHRHAASAWKNLMVDLPEQIYLCPKVNAFKHAKVGVFRFSEPAYASGTGRMAAEAVFDDLLRKGVFSHVIDEIRQEYLDIAGSLELALARGYDLIITGDVLYYFDGSDFMTSSVHERINVVHVSTRRVLWSACAKEMAPPAPSRDFLLFQRMGAPAKPATALIEKNAEKFSNMLLKQPKQKDEAQASVAVSLSSHNEAIKGLKNQINDLLAQNTLLEQQYWKEVDKAKELEQEVDELAAQTDQFETQLKEEIEKGQITAKRLEKKTIITIDDSICFDSGSAVLKRDVKDALVKISETFRNFPNSDIQIEGHTDDIPIRSPQFPSNWELSSARALAVLQFLLDSSKIDPARLSSAGYGEYYPIVPNDSPENRRLNRRVDIVIVPSDNFGFAQK